jgi:hypothetical protein
LFFVLLFFTVIAIAFRWPTTTTSFLPPRDPRVNQVALGRQILLHRQRREYDRELEITSASRVSSASPEEKLARFRQAAFTVLDG